MKESCEDFTDKIRRLKNGSTGIKVDHGLRIGNSGDCVSDQYVDGNK